MKEVTDRGEMEFSGNELKVDATIEDAPKVRQGVYDERQHTVAAFSGDFLTRLSDGSTHRAEKILLSLKYEPALGGYYRFQGQRPGTDDDKNMITLLDLFTDKAVFYVPVVYQAGGPSVPEPPPQPPIPNPPPTPGTNLAHGIAAGDFVGVLRYFGFASDDVVAYSTGRLSWADADPLNPLRADRFTSVIGRMDRRKG